MSGLREGDGGHLAANLMHFGRLLRAGGLPVGSDRILDAVRTLDAVGLERRDDVYWALHSVFVRRREDHALFDRAFSHFWRAPQAPATSGLPTDATRVPEPAAGADATGTGHAQEHAERGEAPEPQDGAQGDPAVFGYSAREALRERDFAVMSDDELRRARALIARLEFPLPPLPTRRLRPDPHGARVDLRASLRAGLRAGGHDLPLRWRSRRTRPPTLVALCDVSGSMERYTTTLLHFLHALRRRREQVETFLFGTRLTHATRFLRHADVETALSWLAPRVRDWGGGTRIGECLHRFNRDWSRRVLGSGAVVLLISDGLDREGGVGLSVEAERLRRSCRWLVWLNPLLGDPRFEPRAAGIRALLPHVDDVRPVHDLASLEALARALGGGAPARRRSFARPGRRGFARPRGAVHRIGSPA